MGKRRFLKTLFGFGITGTALRHITKDVVAKVDLRKEVPRLKALRHANDSGISNGEEPKREAIYYTIPRDRWEYIEGVAKAANRVDRYFNSDLITAIFKKKGSELVIQPHYTKVVKPSGEELKPSKKIHQVKSELPNRVTGSLDKKNTSAIEKIPVLSPTNETKRMNAYFDDDYYQNVPGGCESQVLDETGTLCSPAWDNDRGEFVLTTAGHLVTAEDYRMYQPSSTAEVNGWTDKKVFQNGGGYDYGTIDNISGYQYEMAGGDIYKKYDTSGSLGGDAIKDMAYNNEYLFNQGRTTGRKFTKIEDVWVNDFREPYKIQVNATTSSGDSGGPYFTESSSDSVDIAGIHSTSVSYGDNKSDDSRGNTMNYIESHLNIKV